MPTPCASPPAVPSLTSGPFQIPKTLQVPSPISTPQAMSWSRSKTPLDIPSVDPPWNFRLACPLVHLFIFLPALTFLEHLRITKFKMQPLISPSPDLLPPPNFFISVLPDVCLPKKQKTWGGPSLPTFLHRMQQEQGSTPKLSMCPQGTLPSSTVITGLDPILTLLDSTAAVSPFVSLPPPSSPLSHSPNLP